MENNNRVKCMFVTRKARGGIRTHLKTLANKLPKYNISPVICAPKEDFEHTISGGEFYHLPLEDGFKIKDYKNVFKLKELIKKTKPDIVHSHGYKASLIVAMAKSMVNFSWITTIHNFQTSSIRRKTFKFFVKNILNRADKIQLVSNSLKRELISVGIDEEKCTVLYNGISLPSFHRPIDNRLSLPKGKLIGCIGRLNHDKGIDNFIYSVKYLYERYNNYFNSRRYYFLIIGDGPEKEKLQKLTWNLGLASKIMFLGHREDVTDILKSLEVLCIPSRHEGLSITALEAMASFCPVIAAKKGGLVELINHFETGLLCPSDDPIKMGEAIMTLVKNQKIRRRIALQAYINVISNFNDEIMIKNVIDQYNGVKV
ncbi:glycosyltransferase family 4 protein [Natranaerofaba carboxydovora]|uniref:glycosyltransferase family 4 protein n=1 Tax=Natranaerofaba carboxydovora TaxID=2742683 RepID=UPI001F131590|nr:glycosyltransferase family 4 protein [Natranaerofaba carboxydovora]UMZ74847.1 2-deoxystreptamine N-acetyl-D-glucosaminyltransferase [Natranaerofaba carboxydovora]